jgi:PD-(D/E)XK nuclease superfamily
MPGASIDHEHQRMTVSQSWLQDLQRCPERARQELLHPTWEHTSETAIGTALHLFMELRLLGSTFASAVEESQNWLLGVVENVESSVSPLSQQTGQGYGDPTYRATMGKDTMVRHLAACIGGFDRHVVPQVPGGGHVETKVKADLGHDDGWTIVLEGRPDYVDPFDRVWDWKTAASAYNVNETTRWAIQPTAYTYLASQVFATHCTEFTFAVGVKPHGVIQFIDLRRHPDDWQWLARIARGALGLARTLLHSEWPVNHGHWLCSEKWCPHWDGCRGKYTSNEGDEQ